MFLCFTPILLQAFRTMIVFIFLLTIIMLFVVYSNNKLQILKYIIIAFLLIEVYLNNLKITELNEKIKDVSHHIAIKEYETTQNKENK